MTDKKDNVNELINSLPITSDRFKKISFTRDFKYVDVNGNAIYINIDFIE
jgi:hypothetical protein